MCSALELGRGCGWVGVGAHVWMRAALARQQAGRVPGKGTWEGHFSGWFRRASEIGPGRAPRQCAVVLPIQFCLPPPLLAVFCPAAEKDVEVMDEDPAYIFRFPTPPDVGACASRAGGSGRAGRTRPTSLCRGPHRRRCLHCVPPPRPAGALPCSNVHAVHAMLLALPPQCRPPSWASPTWTLATPAAPPCSTT